MGIVTISASYGTVGDRVGPAVAAALGLPFVDRAIPLTVARELGVSVEDAEAQDGRAATGWWRLISSMAMVPDLVGGENLVYNKVTDERIFKDKTEDVLRRVADGPGAVILGRCASVVFHDRPDALHVRLDGPIDQRVKIVTEYSDVNPDEARKRIASTDRAREAYAHTFYKRSLSDPLLYHLLIDATAFDPDDVVAMIVHAAKLRNIGPAQRSKEPSA